MRGDQFRAWVKRRPQHTLMKVGPVKRLPKLPSDGTFSVVTVATQVAEVHATAQHKDRDEQRGKELPLRLTEAGHLLQDVVDDCHKLFTGERGSGIRSPYLTSLWPHLLTPFVQKLSEVLMKKISLNNSFVTFTLCVRYSRFYRRRGRLVVAPFLFNEPVKG